MNVFSSIGIIVTSMLVACTIFYISSFIGDYLQKFHYWYFAKEKPKTDHITCPDCQYTFKIKKG